MDSQQDKSVTWCTGHEIWSQKGSQWSGGTQAGADRDEWCPSLGAGVEGGVHEPPRGQGGAGRQPGEGGQWLPHELNPLANKQAGGPAKLGGGGRG